MEQQDITSTHYNNLDEAECFSNYSNKCLNAKLVSNNLIYLPCYPNYGINNVLHLSGFEEYMNDCLSEQSELQRTYTEHPYLNDETNKIEYPNCEKSTDDIFVNLLEECKEAGDDANSKLAKETLKKVEVIGVEKAMEEMAVNCFKPTTVGKTSALIRSLSYS